MKKLLTLLLLLVFSTGYTQNICLSAEEKKIYDLLISYRKGKGLSSIPVSGKLTKVAQAHARDLAENYDYSQENNPCNMHSWSDKGSWSACCYTDDHAQAACMWNKPKEIAGYEGSGYEIAHFNSAGVTAQEAIDGWKGSKFHNEVMINLSIWKQVKWQAVGVGVYKEFAVVWFGEKIDSVGAERCK
ncbi:MAG: CAP domain-containing protein [Flammeovirgaceae bacterium]|nr:CAP domain-containing protein [Flammeovirgaceae bacterium]